MAGRWLGRAGPGGVGLGVRVVGSDDETALGFWAESAGESTPVTGWHAGRIAGVGVCGIGDRIMLLF
jgi:hypothetical protein